LTEFEYFKANLKCAASEYNAASKIKNKNINEKDDSDMNFKEFKDYFTNRIELFETKLSNFNIDSLKNSFEEEIFKVVNKKLEN